MPILQSEVSEFVEGMKLAQDYQVNKWQKSELNQDISICKAFTFLLLSFIFNSQSFSAYEYDRDFQRAGQHCFLIRQNNYCSFSKDIFLFHSVTIVIQIIFPDTGIHLSGDQEQNSGMLLAVGKDQLSSLAIFTIN